MMLGLIEHKLQSKNWTENFEGLNLLRTLNKSYPGDVYKLFEAYGVFIIGYLKSPKSCLLKNCLALVHEVLSLKCQLHPQILLKIVPLLLQLGCHTSKSTKLCAQGCLSLVIQSHANSASIFALAKSATASQGPKIHVYAFKSLMKAIYRLKERVGELELSSLQASFRAISRQLSDAKRKHRSKAQKLCQYFMRLMGQNNFQKFLQNLVDAKEVTLKRGDDLMTAALDNGATVSRFTYRDFMQQNRESVRLAVDGVKKHGHVNEIHVDGVVYKC